MSYVRICLYRISFYVQYLGQPKAMTQVPLVDATFSGQTTNQFNYGVDVPLNTNQSINYGVPQMSNRLGR